MFYLYATAKSEIHICSNKNETGRVYQYCFVCIAMRRVWCNIKTQHMIQSRDKYPKEMGLAGDTFIESHLTTHLTDQFYIFFRTEAIGQGQSEPKTKCHTWRSQYVPTNKSWGSYLKYHKRHRQDTIFLELRPGVKVTVTQKQYATLCNPKTCQHTKFGIPTSNNIRDMLWTWLF